MAQPLGVALAGRGVKFSDIVSDPDSLRVTPEDFANFYRRNGGGLQVTTGAGRGAQADALTAALFKHLDANSDGKLSKEELAVAEKVLRGLEVDDDELISAAELVPNVNQTGGGGQFVIAPPQGGPPTSAFFVVSRDDSNRRLTQRLTLSEQLLARYDRDRNRKLSREEIALDKEVFDELDANRDGGLDGIDLLKLLHRPPDIVLTVRLGRLGGSEAALEAGDKAMPLAAAVGKPANGAVAITFDDAQIELRRGEAFRGNFASTRQVILQQFKAADTNNKGHLELKDLEQNPRFQFLRAPFSLADRDDDGKLTEAELTAYLDFQEQLSESYTVLTIGDSGRGLFEVLDANRDGWLSVRELRSAWSRVAAFDRAGAGAIGRTSIPRQFQVMLSPGQPGNLGRQVVVAGAGAPPPPVLVPTRGPLWFRKMDRNGDGDVSLREFLGSREDFAKIDTDGDGLISVEEATTVDGERKKPGDDRGR
jgi:Ca2+-binding EF-hand superfamily protein